MRILPYIGIITNTAAFTKYSTALPSSFNSISTATRPLTNIYFSPLDNSRRQFYRSSLSMKSQSEEEKAAIKAAKEYESSDNDKAGPPTVFDKILSGEWSSNKVYEDDLCLAFRDINPQSPTHVLVIPKKRDGLIKLSKAREDQKNLLGHLMYVAQDIGKKECPKGFRVVINDGEHGAQSVYHLHLHVMGGRAMKWPPG